MEDGQVWADNTNEVNMLAKVAKYKQSYLDAQGEGYQTRKQRDDANTEKAKNDYDNASWDVKRGREYPRVKDQLDKIYHEGIDAWKNDMIKPIKDKYPKE